MIEHKPQPQHQQQNINNSYSNLLYEASVDKLSGYRIYRVCSRHDGRTEDNNTHI